MVVREIANKDLQRIVEASDNPDNDLRAVSMQDLQSSHALYGICSESGEGLIGFARQAERYRVASLSGEINIAEIGTVWVEPEHREKGVGSELIKIVTAELQKDRILPLAVCNELSRFSFAKNGFEEIGHLAPTSRGHKRVVMINLEDTYGEQLTIPEVIAGVRALPRFKDFVPYLARGELE